MQYQVFSSNAIMVRTRQFSLIFASHGLILPPPLQHNFGLIFYIFHCEYLDAQRLISINHKKYISIVFTSCQNKMYGRVFLTAQMFLRTIMSVERSVSFQIVVRKLFYVNNLYIFFINIHHYSINVILVRLMYLCQEIVSLYMNI